MEKFSIPVVKEVRGDKRVLEILRPSRPYIVRKGKNVLKELSGAGGGGADMVKTLTEVANDFKDQLLALEQDKGAAPVPPEDQTAEGLRGFRLSLLNLLPAEWDHHLLGPIPLEDHEAAAVQQAFETVSVVGAKQDLKPRVCTVLCI